MQQGLQDAIPMQAQVIPKSSRAQEKPGVPPKTKELKKDTYHMKLRGYLRPEVTPTPQFSFCEAPQRAHCGNVCGLGDESNPVRNGERLHGPRTPPAGARAAAPRPPPQHLSPFPSISPFPVA